MAWGGLGVYNNAQAFSVWPFSQLITHIANTDNDDHAPPPADALKLQCDPYRQAVVDLRQQDKLGRTLSRPRQYQLKKKYRECLKRFHREEYDYLKHATITIPPSEAPEVQSLSTGDLPPMNPVNSSVSETASEPGDTTTTNLSEEAHNTNESEAP